VDATGDVLVTGCSRNASNNDNYLTVKYSNQGVPLWTNRYNGPADIGDDATAIALDSAGNVFVTGSSVSSIADVLGYATIKYSSAGVPVWTNRLKLSTSNSSARAIAVDSNGNVFVTGSALSASTDYDYATVAYSAIGIPLWTNRFNGAANGADGANAIAVAMDGKVFVTGYSSTSRAYPYNWGYATIAYSNTGAPLWTNRFNGSGVDYHEPRAIAVDPSGNVIVTGESDINSGSAFATIAYSSEGLPLWTNRYKGPADLSASVHGMTVDRNGNVFVTGRSFNGTNHDYVTIKYSSSVPPSARLDFQRLSNQVVLSWTVTGLNLQSAPAITGTFTNLPAATSPYTNALAGPQQFFRLRSD
jgi:hypothetical protein